MSVKNFMKLDTFIFEHLSYMGLGLVANISDSVVCDIKGTSQPAYPRSLISNFAICVLESIKVKLLSEKCQYSVSSLCI